MRMELDELKEAVNNVLLENMRFGVFKPQLFKKLLLDIPAENFDIAKNTAAIFKMLHRKAGTDPLGHAKLECAYFWNKRELGNTFKSKVKLLTAKKDIDVLHRILDYAHKEGQKGKPPRFDHLDLFIYPFERGDLLFRLTLYPTGSGAHAMTLTLNRDKKVNYAEVFEDANRSKMDHFGADLNVKK